LSGATVWLASYPKSGNTWLRAVVTAWRSGGPVDLSHLDGSIASSRWRFDEALGVPSSSMTPDEAELVRPRVDELLAATSERVPLLRKVHDGYFLGPAGEPIISSAATRCALYVVRDPRDVAVSLAHHSQRSLDWARRRLADPRAAMNVDASGLAPLLRERLGSWSEHVRSWVDETPFEVEVLRYEDCATAPVATFARALRFAGLEPIDEASVTRAVENASFDRLRAAEDRDGFVERPVTAPKFFRRGEAGGWRDELPPDLAAAIETDHGEVMARFGYR
jgi:hypothetical protein